MSDEFLSENSKDECGIARRIGPNELLEIRRAAERALDGVRDAIKELNGVGKPYVDFGWHHIIVMEEKKIRKELHGTLWKFLVESSELASVMSSNERNKMFQKFHDDPPEFTDDEVEIYARNIRSFYVENAGNMAKSVYTSMIGQRYGGDNDVSEKYDNLRQVERVSRCYGNIKYDVYCQKFRYDYWQETRWGVNYDDLLRVLRIIDGKSHGYGFEFRALAESCLFSGNDIETEYFKITPYKNGNNKITFTDEYILARFNKLCGGGRLPDVVRKRYKREHFNDGELRAMDFEGYRQRYANPRSDAEGFVETSERLVNLLVDVARICKGDDVLEPSAGNGAIVDALLRVGARCTAVEINQGRRERLKERFHTSVNFTLDDDHDFVAAVTRGRLVDRFDKIVMNPPFESYNSVAHVLSAWKCLNEGGTLVALMPTSIMFRQDGTFPFFREFLKKHGRKLPEPYSFRDMVKVSPDGLMLTIGGGIFEGTGVGCCVVKLVKGDAGREVDGEDDDVEE